MMFARTKGRVHCNIHSIFLSTNNKCHVTNIYTVEEKQKYHYIILREKHITSRSSKRSWKRFLAAFVILIEESFLSRG